MVWAIAYLMALANAPPAIVLIDKPVTVAMDVPEPARRSEVLFLKLEGVVAQRSAPVMWNVFWNMPEANAQTSVDNEHFVGYIASPANSAVRHPKPANYTVELPVAAVRAAHRLRTIRFTFVPLRKLPEGGVTITALRLE